MQHLTVFKSTCSLLLAGALGLPGIVALGSGVTDGLSADSLVPNGDLEIDADRDGRPDDWFAAPGVDGVTVDWPPLPGQGHALHAADTSKSAGQGVWWRSHATRAPAADRVGSFRWRWRYTGVHPDGVQVVFRFFDGPPSARGGATGRFLGQVGRTARGSSPGWVAESVGFVVPTEAGSTDVLVYSNTDRVTGEVFVDSLEAELAEPISDGARLLWQIGRGDNSTSEFALGPRGWRRFAAESTGAPVFAVGHSDSKQHWPYVHPGPVDLWAGGRMHAFTILFGIDESSRAGRCRLWVDLADTHSQHPPRLRIDVNGRVSEFAVPSGAGDASVNGDPLSGKEHRIALELPSDGVRPGTNRISITTLSGSWVLYDWIGFEAPPSVRSGPSETTVLRGIAVPPLLVRRDAALRQLVEISLLHLGESEAATVRIGAGEQVEQILQSGENRIEVAVPVVEAPTEVTVAVEVAGRSLAEQSVRLEGVRRWEVYFLPHSHTDIGYTHLQQEVAERQWGYFEQAIELARRTAEYPTEARFRWNVEVLWAVDGYLDQASPQKRQRFIEAVKKNQIGLDALYGSELTGLCRPEELFELVGFARRLSLEHGLTIDSAMISDVPGYSWGLVPALAHSGVKYFSSGPNHMPHLPHWGDRIGYTLREWGDRPFYWVSPSGEERILCWVAGHGYSWFHGWILGSIKKAGPRPILRYLEELDDSDYPYDIVQLRYTIGADNGPPDPDLPEFVKDWNKRYAYPRMVIATTSQLFRRFEERYADRIPRFRGDFTPYWEDGAASSARETAINRGNAERLVQAATLWSMLDPRGYPAADFEAAWRNVVLYDEHTWGAHNSISQPDDPFVLGQWKVKQAFALDGETQSRRLLAGALEERAAAAKRVTAVHVFNTSSWPRTDLVVLPREWGLPGEQVRDPEGKPVPSQRLASGGLGFLARDVPPTGGARFTVHPGRALPSGSARAEGTTLTDGLLMARVDPTTGAIASLRSSSIPVDLVDSSAGPGLNDYVYSGRNAANPRRSGTARVRATDDGPLVASLRAESAAPGCQRLVREVQLVSGLGRLDVIDTVDKRGVREKENVRFAFPFHVPGGQIRYDVAWGVVRPDADQLAGANKSYITVGRWVDVSGQGFGLTWTTVDAPLVEVGGMTGESWMADPTRPWVKTIGSSQKLYSWVMNNSWHTNYKADQEGPTVFRYSLAPHGAFDAGAAERRGIERSQPLIVVPAKSEAPVEKSLLEVRPAGFVVTSLRPASDAEAYILRLFNASGRSQQATLVWGRETPRVVYRSSPFEERGEEIEGPLVLPAWGIVTLRAELPSRGGDVKRSGG